MLHKHFGDRSSASNIYSLAITISDLMKLQRLTCSVILLIRSIYINSVNCERIKADALDDAVAAAQNAIDAANTAQQIAIQATEFAIEATNNATEIAVLAAAGAAGSYAATAAFEAIGENGKFNSSYRLL